MFCPPAGNDFPCTVYCRPTWRHNQVLRVVKEAIGAYCVGVNEPRDTSRQWVGFVKAGAKKPGPLLRLVGQVLNLGVIGRSSPSFSAPYCILYIHLLDLMSYYGLIL